MKRLFLIDAANHFFKAYYAVRGLTNIKGEPTNAVYGFTAMLRKLLNDWHPEYLVACWDGPEKTFRHKMFEGYKASRSEMPDDLVPQLPHIRRMSEALGAHVIECPGYEADDIIATLTRRALEDGFDEVYIVSNDKDLFQLVNDKVRMLRKNRGEETVIDAAVVEEIFGVPPGQVRDVLSLMGDSVDDIPGVPGIGEKGAKSIIRKYGDLETAREHDLIMPFKRYRGKLTEHWDEALMSRKLIELEYHVPIDRDWPSLENKGPDGEALRALYEEMGFKTFLRAIERDLNKNEPTKPKAKAESKAPQKAAADSPKAAKKKTSAPAPLPSVAKSSNAPVNAKPWKEAASVLTPQSAWAWDWLETQDSVTLAFFALQGKESGLAALAQSDIPLWLNKLGALDQEQAVFDAKALQRLALKHGASVPKNLFDIHLAAFITSPHEGRLGLDALASRFLGESPPKKAAGPTLFDDDSETLSQNARTLARLHGPVRSALKEGELDGVYAGLDLPIQQVLSAMEHRGITLDLSVLKDLEVEFAAAIETLEKDIQILAGEDFNVASSQQLGQILFEKLGLPAKKKTAKTRAWSTASEVLEALEGKHAIVSKVLDFRQKKKLLSTYVEALPRLVRPETGRVHTTFDPCGTATGRLSSLEPNLQNIPIRTPEGRRIRKAFIPMEGGLLISADYSQIELRVLAHMSGDTTMLDAFLKGEDIHARTAREIFSLPEGDVDKTARRRAKAVNFGVLYGMGARALAKQTGVKQAEAKEFIESYFARYSAVKDFMDSVLKKARSDGYVSTLLGRKRPLPELEAKNPGIRAFGERAAFNAVIQGSAADLMKLAMLDVHQALECDGHAWLLLQVHDELVLEVDKEQAYNWAWRVKSLMEQVGDSQNFRIPLTVDVRLGQNWLDMKGLDKKNQKTEDRDGA